MLASPRWICVTTPHFEMYTTNSEKQAVQALQSFEQVRFFFLQNSKNKQAPEDLVRIIAFSSEKDFKPYRTNSGTFAYYLQSHERDYIVMQDIEADHHQTAVHEYTHLIVQHTKMQLPIWLNEGLADLYSSLESRGPRQAMIGRTLPSRMATLAQQKWMDWNVLFAVGYDSPFYNEKEKMSIFYAQSWALTHMLALSPAYNHGFSSFLLAIGNGMNASEALQKVYGKTIPEVGKSVEAYVRQTSLKAAVYDIPLRPADLHAQVSEPSDLQAGLILANLLAARKETRDEAQRRLTVLAQQNAQNAEMEESLGYLAWQEENLPEARKHFSLAVERGSKNDRMIYDLAGLEQNSSAPPQTVVALLQRVLVLKPDNNEARILLAEVEANRGHYGPAIAALAPIHTVRPEQAFRFFFVAAHCHANMQDLSEAKNLLEKAASYAKAPVEREQVNRLRSALDRVNRPLLTPASPDLTDINSSTTAAPLSAGSVPTVLKRSQGLPRISGKTKEFECSQGGFRLHLQVGARELVFGMGNLQDIVVRNVKDLQWRCGPLLSQEVTVVYEPADTAKLDGTVSELIF